jgi:hypothetical protein
MNNALKACAFGLFVPGLLLLSTGCVSTKRNPIREKSTAAKSIDENETEENLGMISIQSTFGRYLQSHTDGEMHCSNEHVNEEETWFLIEVDKTAHVYAIRNWRNGKYLSKRANGCVWAVESVIGPSEKWVFVSGKKYGIENAVAFKSYADDTYMGTYPPGQDIGKCGGEVAAESPADPPANNGGWPGWWVLQGVGEPQPGKDFWNVVGGKVGDVLNQIKPADVVALIAYLAG